jgi:hydrogenase maturation protease
MSGRTLVAGVGNVFLQDDAFGVEVIRLLTQDPLPPGVQARDFGIRGVHLVYELLDGCDLFVLVDAAARGEEPGTVTVLEVDVPEPGSVPRTVIDAHSLAPDDIFALLASLGGRPGRSLVVACEPADVSAGMGLTEPVREALPHAVRAVREILARSAGAQTEDVTDEQEVMADLSRPGKEVHEHDRQADQGSYHRRRAGAGDRLTAGHQAVPRTT